MCLCCWLSPSLQMSVLQGKQSLDEGSWPCDVLQALSRVQLAQTVLKAAAAVCGAFAFWQVTVHVVAGLGDC